MALDNAELLKLVSPTLEETIVDDFDVLLEKLGNKLQEVIRREVIAKIRTLNFNECLFFMSLTYNKWFLIIAH